MAQKRFKREEARRTGLKAFIQQAGATLHAIDSVHHHGMVAKTAWVSDVHSIAQLADWSRFDKTFYVSCASTTAAGARRSHIFGLGWSDVPEELQGICKTAADCPICCKLDKHDEKDVRAFAEQLYPWCYRVSSKFAVSTQLQPGHGVVLTLPRYGNAGDQVLIIFSGLRLGHIVLHPDSASSWSPKLDSFIQDTLSHPNQPVDAWCFTEEHQGGGIDYDQLPSGVVVQVWLKCGGQRVVLYRPKDANNGIGLIHAFFASTDQYSLEPMHIKEDGEDEALGFLLYSRRDMERMQRAQSEPVHFHQNQRVDFLSQFGSGGGGGGVWDDGPSLFHDEDDRGPGGVVPEDEVVMEQEEEEEEMVVESTTSDPQPLTGEPDEPLYMTCFYRNNDWWYEFLMVDMGRPCLPCVLSLDSEARLLCVRGYVGSTVKEFHLRLLPESLGLTTSERPCFEYTTRTTTGYPPDTSMTWEESFQHAPSKSQSLSVSRTELMACYGVDDSIRPGLDSAIECTLFDALFQ